MGATRGMHAWPAASATAGAERGTSEIIVPITMHWLWAPLGLLFLVPTPTLAGSLSLPASSFPAMFGQPLFLDAGMRLTAVAYFAILVVGAILAVRMSATTHGAIRLDVRAQVWLNRAVRVLFCVTVLAYLIWLGIAVSHGLSYGAVHNLLSGDPGAMYVLRQQYFETAGGITTWMEVGVVVAPLAILRSRAGLAPARFVLGTLFLLALVRALLDSERLALIEVAVSAGIAYLMLRSEAPRFLRGIRVVFVFVAAWAALLLIFGGFEFFRSWNTQGVGSAQGFWAFAGTLLFGYYATALNLAAFDSSMLHGQTWVGYLFNGDIYGSLFGSAPTAGMQNYYGLQTYTNRSGLLVPANAFGLVGGGVVIAVVTILIVLAARRAATGGLIAFVAYCSFAVGVLEIVRIFYYGDSRFLPILIALAGLLISWRLSRRGSRYRTARSDRRVAQWRA